MRSEIVGIRPLHAPYPLELNVIGFFGAFGVLWARLLPYPLLEYFP